jgi:uncharacterized membrane protein YkoI
MKTDNYVLSLLFLGTLCLFSTSAWSDRHPDHDEARNLRLKGEILPFSHILEKAEQAGIRTVLDVELERENDQWHYEVEGLTDNNRLLKLTIHADNGEIVDTQYKKRPHKDRN